MKQERREKEKGRMWGRKEEGVYFNLSNVISLSKFLAIQCYVPCSLASDCILFPPAIPNCVVDVSPLECV